MSHNGKGPMCCKRELLRRYLVGLNYRVVGFDGRAMDGYDRRKLVAFVRAKMDKLEG